MSIFSKYSLALPLFLIAAASNFNPVSAGIAFGSRNELLNAVNSYCDGTFDPDLSSIAYGRIEDWDVSRITDMERLFENEESCNPAIGNWDVSNVVNFYLMFARTMGFNQDISGWNVSSGTSLRGMFQGAAAFDKHISDWNVSSVTDFYAMFHGATAFNQDISDWNVSSVTGFGNMFLEATAFNQDISKWNVGGSGTNFRGMFNGATAFNQDISDWDVSSGTNFGYMFNRATTFNQDISGWDVSSGTDFNSMFNGATSFDQPLIFCKWHSNDSFKTGTDVCSDLDLCGWGETTCPTPEPSPTAAPTAAAEKAKNAYQISLIDDSIDVAFNASRLDKEIMMNLNITTDNIDNLSNPIKVFDYDTCKTTEYGSAMLAASAMLEANTTMGVFSSVPVEVNLNTTDIVSYNNSVTYPGFFNAEDESVVLQFCLKPTLGSSDVVRNGTVETSYISYTKIKVQIKLNMTMDFSTAEVNIKEDAPIQTTKESSVDYTLDAYECDAATKVRITAPSVKSQNSLVTVCIESSFDDIIVGSIKELTLTQSSSGLVFKAIDDSLPTAITEVSSTGTKKAAVTTRLVSAFFTDLGDEQSEIEITGTAVLKFGSGERKLVRIGNSDDRALQGNDSADPLGEFAVSVDILKDNDDMSAATQAKRFLATLFSALMGSALVL